MKNCFWRLKRRGFNTNYSNFNYEFYEFSNFTNLECSRLRDFDYEFYESSNFTNLECSWSVLELRRNTPN